MSVVSGTDGNSRERVTMVGVDSAIAVRITGGAELHELWWKEHLWG